jgi:hypothetical protein
VGKHGRVVLSGPFNGLKYTRSAVCSAYAAKLVGCYECELHPFLTAALQRGYQTVIDIGCAEGYYAVGWAFKAPSSKVLAFDVDPEARFLCDQLARLNRVEARVCVLGNCDGNALANAIKGRTLIICDCEGYELTLIDPDRTPELNQADLIVELHEFLSPGLTQTLVSRLERSHDIVLVDTVERNCGDYPQLEIVGEADRQFAVREGRPAQ